MIEPSPSNAQRVLEALHEFGAPVAAHGVSRADFEAPDNVYQLGLPPRRIDLLTSISGVAFEEARATRIVVELAGMMLPVLGRDALVKKERATGRPKDIVDTDALEQGGPVGYLSEGFSSEEVLAVVARVTTEES